MRQACCARGVLARHVPMGYGVCGQIVPKGNALAALPQCAARVAQLQEIHDGPVNSHWHSVGACVTLLRRGMEACRHHQHRGGASSSLRLPRRSTGRCRRRRGRGGPRAGHPHRSPGVSQGMGPRPACRPRPWALQEGRRLGGGPRAWRLRRRCSDQAGSGLLLWRRGLVLRLLVCHVTMCWKCHRLHCPMVGQRCLLGKNFYIFKLKFSCSTPVQPVCDVCVISKPSMQDSQC